MMLCGEERYQFGYVHPRTHCAPGMLLHAAQRRFSQQFAWQVSLTEPALLVLTYSSKSPNPWPSSCTKRRFSFPVNTNMPNPVPPFMPDANTTILSYGTPARRTASVTSD